MNNRPLWQDKINDPNTVPSKEIERVKQLKKSSWLTHSNWDWNYNQQLANNTFSLRHTFDTIIETLERSYYHDMMENDMISGFYKHIALTTDLIATNADPRSVEGIGGGELDRIPPNYHDPTSKGRGESLIGEKRQDGVVNNPITKRAQPDKFEDYYGKNLATKLGVTWFKYVWTWDFIESMNREIFERTKLLNHWLDKNTFCKYHDIFQHSLLVYINGLPVNDFSVMFTKSSNMLKLPFDNKLFMDIQKGHPIDIQIYRIATKKHYWAQLTYERVMRTLGGIVDASTWTDYYDLFDPGNTDIVILNLCEQKTNSNIAYREQEKTEMLQGPQTIILHLHKREDGSSYLDLNEIDPQVLSWWKAVNYVDADLIRPKNMFEYSVSGEYPYPVTKDEFSEESNIATNSYDNIYDVIDLKQALKRDSGEELGVSELDILCFKQHKNDGAGGRDKLYDGWRPTPFTIDRMYPNTFRITRKLSKNDIVEIKQYSRYFDVITDLSEGDIDKDDIEITQSSVDQTSTHDPLPNARVFYFTKTVYKDTDLDPIVLRAMKVARRYLFNPYRYTPPIFKNLVPGTEFTIRMDANKDEKFIVVSNDYPVKGKTLCVKKYALKVKRSLPDRTEVDTVANDYMDIYHDEFTTPLEVQEYQNGDRSHLWGRFGVSAIRFITKNDIPYFNALENSTQTTSTRFFDLSINDLNDKHTPIFPDEKSRICYLDETETTPVRYRLRDQSTAVKTYGKPYERPAYVCIDDTGKIDDTIYPDDDVYLRPCILIDNDYDFVRWNKLDDGIKVELPEYLYPYPLTHWADSELLRVIASNKQYFMKYIKTLFPDDNYYGVEKFYRYSDQNMANMMDIVENIPDYDNDHDGIIGSPFGNGNQVVDYTKPEDVKDMRKWIVKKATIAYIPEKIGSNDDRKWVKNYTINSHVMTENGVHLVVNMADYREKLPTMYQKSISIIQGGKGYMLHDRIYIKDIGQSEFMVHVVRVDGDGSVLEVDVPRWVDGTKWTKIVQCNGGHGSGIDFSLEQLVITSEEKYTYYPYAGMELHIENPEVYDYDPAGRYLETTLLSGTGQGLLVNIESDNIEYSLERDHDMWMYPFDYLTLKLKNFIKLYPDNFMSYLTKQFKKPFQDWNIRVFKDADISEYKRYHTRNVYTYNSSIDLDHGIGYTEFMMPYGYHSKLKFIKVYREYDVYATGDELTTFDGRTMLVACNGKRLISHQDDSGDIFAVDGNGNRIWRVLVLNDSGEWIETNDPEFDVKHAIRLVYQLDTIYHAKDADYPHYEDKFEYDNYPQWEIPDVMQCSVHWEFLTIRDTTNDPEWQEPNDFEPFDQPKFLVKFNNEEFFDNDKNTDDSYMTEVKDISYLPFIGGFEKPFCMKEHYEKQDYVYMDWESVYNLKGSFIEKQPEHHTYYRIKDFKISDNSSDGMRYHPGMELHLHPIDTSKYNVPILAIVDRVDVDGRLVELHIHDHQRTFKDYDPTGLWKVIMSDYQRQDDKFHIGNGEQNSYDAWDRINWFADESNRESINTPTIEINGEMISDEWTPGEKYFVETNNTYTIRRQHHYYWEQNFELPSTDENWGDGAILHPDENRYNELHLEDLKIVNVDTNEIVPYDIADGKELFTLFDVEPDVNKSVQFRNRYDLKLLNIRDYNLNLKQTLYDIGDITVKKLRNVSDIRRMCTVDRVFIDPSATEWIDKPITIENIEPGNETNCMNDYYIPEDIFRKEWNISDEIIFDHRDYTFSDMPMVDANGKVIMYATIDIRHTTLPFNFSGLNEVINNQTVPNLNNRPIPPVGPSHPSWSDDMKYYPDTDEYVREYYDISPNNVPGVVWKPDRYDFPFEAGPEITAGSAMGTDTHIVENSYIRIKHIYNVRPADGVKTIDRSKIWPSPSSKYNNDTPEAYTMGDPIDKTTVDLNNPNSYHRKSNDLSYIDPPIFLELGSKMYPYTGLVFTYSEGFKWVYDKDLHKYIKTDTPIHGIHKRVINIGMNIINVTLRSDDGKNSDTKPIKIYIGKREDGPPDDGSKWIYQEAYQQLRPPFDGQNYQNNVGNMPYQKDHGRGQYVQFYALETYYDPTPSNGKTSATNKFDGNFANPQFNYPKSEDPLYKARVDKNGVDVEHGVSEDDNYYPTYDPKYENKIHENTMRSGYADADYTPYQAQYGIWYDLSELTVQGGSNDNESPYFDEPWLIPGNIKYTWDYEKEHTLNKEKIFDIMAYTELDQMRNDLHCDHVHWSKIRLTLWQSQEPKDGFIQHVDDETGVKYGVKWDIDKADRQYVKWTKFTDQRWNYHIDAIQDSWWRHSRKPFKIPYSVYGRIIRDSGIDDHNVELHKGNYWVYITPKLKFLGTLLVAGTMDQIRLTPGTPDAMAIVMKPVDGKWYNAFFIKGKWQFNEYTPEENASFTVLRMNGEDRESTVAFLGGEWIEYNDVPIDKFSPEGDRYELNEETRLYKIYVAYERGIIENLKIFSIPEIQTYDFSYLYQSNYYNQLIEPIYEEQMYSAIPYFFKGYQKAYVQIVSTFNEEIIWLPIWTYIGDGTPPFDEDDPDRVWKKIDQKYIDINGNECIVWTAYHQEDFPTNIDQQIKLQHHTYFNMTKDIFYKCKTRSKKVKKHDMSVYILPQHSVHELDCGFAYTDIQYQFRVTGPNGRYKAIIDMIPTEVSSDSNERSFDTVSSNRILTKDRITVRATREDGSTYTVPQLNVPSMLKPLEITNQNGNETIIEFHRHKPAGEEWSYVHNVFPKNPVFASRVINPDGIIDLNYPYLKKLWYRSQFDSDRYEIYSNGRLLTEGDQYTIITPTKIILHGLTSLHNIEIFEINREPHREMYRPSQDMRNRLDAILAGVAVDGSYSNEFTYEEQSMFIESGSWPQVRSDNEKFVYYPYNFDSDVDVLSVPDDSTKLEGDYRWMVDMPYIEGAPLYSNIQFDDYYPYISAGMDTSFISNRNVSDIFNKSFTVRFSDGRHIIPDQQLKESINIMWDKVAMSDQEWVGSLIPPNVYPTNYLLDYRYRDHFPQYDLIFGKPIDRLYHDPSTYEKPMLLERDWVRYWYSLPNRPMVSEFRISWDKVAHDGSDWKLKSVDPQICHGGRFNWKGWHKPTSNEDLSYYTMWKTNTKADAKHPWLNQKNRSFYEPDKVFVELDRSAYHSYLGDYIKEHYYQITENGTTVFNGYNGWYPWINPSAPYESNELYWDTGRYLNGRPGGKTQSPYGVSVNNNPTRKNPEVFKYEQKNGVWTIYLDGVYEGDYSDKHLDGLNGIRLLIYNATTDELVRDIINPNGYTSPMQFEIGELPDGVYDVYIDIANRAGIRHGKKFKLDTTNLGR